MKPLAITGVGVVAPDRIGWETFSSTLASRMHGTRDVFMPSQVLGQNDAQAEAKTKEGKGADVSAQELQTLRAARTAEVRDLDVQAWLGDKGHRNFDRLTRHLIIAAKQALTDAGIKKDGAFVALSPQEVGVASATAYGSLDSITELNLVAELEDPRYINPARFPNTVINAAAGYVSIWEDLRAPNATVVNGNPGAIDAILTAETHLTHRRAKCFLIGGGDVVSDPLYLAFDKLGALAASPEQFAPGRENSQGTLLGEGAAFLSVERADDAQKREANVRAWVRGFGTALESPREEVLLLNPSPVAVSRAISLALADANLKPDDIDLVVASSSGLVRYDAAELHGIENVFGPTMPVVAPKNLWGEAFAGGQALALAASVAWLNGAAHPDSITVHATRDVKILVQVAVGYYGNVSAAVLSAA